MSLLLLFNQDSAASVPFVKSPTANSGGVTSYASQYATPEAAYSAASTGTANFAGPLTLSPFIGQTVEYDSVEDWYNSFCYETFLEFDTSGGGTVDSVTLKLWLGGDYSTTDFTVQVYAFDYGASIVPSVSPSGDWQNPTQLSALTPLLGSLNTSGIGSAGAKVITLSTSAVNLSGPTRLIVVSDRTRSGTQPSGDEYIQIALANCLLEYSLTGGAGSIAATLSGSSSTSASAAAAVEKVVTAVGQSAPAGTATFTPDHPVALAGGATSAGTATFTQSATGSVSLAADGTSACAGTATFTPDHSVALAGTATSAGAATFALDHSVTLAGTASSAGTATFTQSSVGSAVAAGTSTSAGAATFTPNHPATLAGASTSAGTSTFAPATPSSVTFTAAGSSATVGTVAAGIGQGLAASGASTTSASSSFAVEHVADATGLAGSAGSATASVAHVATFAGSINAPANASITVARAAMLAGASITAGTAIFMANTGWPIRRYDPATQSWVLCELREWNGTAWVVSRRVKMWAADQNEWILIGA